MQCSGTCRAPYVVDKVGKTGMRNGDNRVPALGMECGWTRYPPRPAVAVTQRGA